MDIFYLIESDSKKRLYSRSPVKSPRRNEHGDDTKRYRRETICESHVSKIKGYKEARDASMVSLTPKSRMYLR
jgi:hypothetical protein